MLARHEALMWCVAVAAVLLALAFWAGWAIHDRLHNVCDFAREDYEGVMSDLESDETTWRLESHVLARYVIACGNEQDIQALKDEYFIYP